MAFSSTVTQGGLSGTRRFAFGTWTGSAADAAGTFSVGSSSVSRHSFWSEDADNPKEVVQTSVSYAGTSPDTATITVYNHQNVTSGKFYVEYN